MKPFGAHHPEAFGNLPGEKITMLESAFATRTLDMKVGPSGLLVPACVPEPVPLPVRQGGRSPADTGTTHECENAKNR